MRKAERLRVPDFFHITQCEVDGCNADIFRASTLCRHHFMAQVQKKLAERQKEQEEAYRRMASPDYAKMEAQGRFQSANRRCCRCQTFGLHAVREKKKSERPKHPKTYFEVLEVICEDCLSDGN